MRVIYWKSYLYYRLFIIRTGCSPPGLGLYALSPWHRCINNSRSYCLRLYKEEINQTCHWPIKTTMHARRNADSSLTDRTAVHCGVFLSSANNELTVGRAVWDVMSTRKNKWQTTCGSRALNMAAGSGCGGTLITRQSGQTLCIWPWCYYTGLHQLAQA